MTIGISSGPSDRALHDRRGSRTSLALLIALCFGIGAVAALFTAESVRTWYPTLAKPAWTPPNWLFAPVWTTLYVLIGIAGWHVRSAPDVPWRRLAWPVWWLQLVLNGAWSPVFFGARAIAAGLMIVVVLWATIVTFIAITWRPDRTAAMLFVPYLAWVTLAAALNFAIWRMN